MGWKMAKYEIEKFEFVRNGKDGYYVATVKRTGMFSVKRKKFVSAAGVLWRDAATGEPEIYYVGRILQNMVELYNIYGVKP